MENLNDTDLSRMLRERGIDTSSDMRPMKEIARQFGLLPVAAEVEIEQAAIPLQEASVIIAANTGLKDSPYFVR